MTSFEANDPSEHVRNYYKNLKGWSFEDTIEESSDEAGCYVMTLTRKDVTTVIVISVDDGK
ncbi:hypothetical protein JXM67_08120 [candidate division WOR-3 bacterium]|nr:hypothetical protein [candidate division WOR-3 bacterium]